MDQYLSTYTKDYSWPRVKKKLFEIPGSPDGENICICGNKSGGDMFLNDYRWSRLGPMGALLDPKLYSIKTGPIPEFETTKQDQPDTYLRKLEEKYPYLYSVIQNPSSDDAFRRVEDDRMRTTYQVDYGFMNESPSSEYDKLLTNKEVPVGSLEKAVLDSKGAPIAKGGSNGSAVKQPRNLAVKAIRKNQGGPEKKDEQGSRNAKKVDDDGSLGKPLSAWTSEYQEVIGQTGRDIINDKIHQNPNDTRSADRIFMGRAILHCRSRA